MWRGTLLQHYFDSRGVARVYVVGLSDGVWTLERTERDFSALEFDQRFAGEVGADRIDGRWEIRGREREWRHDFDIIYRRIG